MVVAVALLLLLLLLSAHGGVKFDLGLADVLLLLVQVLTAPRVGLHHHPRVGLLVLMLMRLLLHLRRHQRLLRLVRERWELAVLLLLLHLLLLHLLLLGSARTTRQGDGGARRCR